VLDGYLPPLLVIGAALLLVGLRRLYVTAHGRRAVPADVAIMTVIVCLAGFLELEMGRTPTYMYGPVRFWSGDIHSNQNSQQVADPYTFTHFTHGAVLYGLTRAALRSSPLGLRAIVTLTAEAAWEVLENTDMVIARYRATTISLGYYGDSVVNSVADVLACVVGFVLAWRLPAPVTVLWIILVEVILALWIRDNLTLNIIMLLYPVRAIRTWQLGA
jgi:hypothetical protein